MSSTFEVVVCDIGFHISNGLAPAQRDGLLSSLIASLPHGADVRESVLDGSLRIGIWLRPPADAAESAARRRSLAALSLLARDQSFGVFLGAGLVPQETPPFGGAWSLHGSVTVIAADTDGGPEGPGRPLRLLPAEILLPNGLKLIAAYDQLTVGADSITAGGTWRLAKRRPVVTIVRPSRTSAEFPDLSCMAQLRVRSTDLRPPLKVSWSAEGLVANPSARSTPILFNVPGARPAEVVAKTVAVRVTDSDGLTADAQTAVQVQITWAGAPAPLAVAPEQVLQRPV